MRYLHIAIGYKLSFFSINIKILLSCALISTKIFIIRTNESISSSPYYSKWSIVREPVLIGKILFVSIRIIFLLKKQINPNKKLVILANFIRTFLRIFFPKSHIKRHLLIVQAAYLFDLMGM